MPIECFFVRDSDLEVFGTPSIEPGDYRVFLDKSREIGSAVLAACHEHDQGGVVFTFDHYENSDEGNGVTLPDLSSQSPDRISSGHLYTKPITDPKLGVGKLLLFQTSLN